jgi:hypothetical protein
MKLMLVGFGIYARVCIAFGMVWFSGDVTKPCHVCTFVSIAGTDMFKCAGNRVVTVILVSLE